MKNNKFIFAVFLLISAFLLSSVSAFAADITTKDNAASTTVEYEPGDVDGNGIVDVSDVTVYQLTLIGKLSQTAAFKKNSETYTDQIKNIRDATAIQMYLVGIYRQLPVTPDGYYAEIFRP